MLFASSIADPRCFSRIRIFSIPDPGSKRFPEAVGNMFQDVHHDSESWIRNLIFYPSPISDSGSRGQKCTGSRILDLDPQHCIQVVYKNFSETMNMVTPTEKVMMNFYYLQKNPSHDTIHSAETREEIFFLNSFKIILPAD
jgi:hypothetical protein